MSNKYFYNDPIKAFYMMKEFGVTIEDYSKEGLAGSAILGAVFKIYIKLESENIFEPRESDRNPFGDTFYKSNHSGKIEVLRVDCVRCDEMEERNEEIAFREGKHFFMPEVELTSPIN